jgi:hypothetical protein
MDKFKLGDKVRSTGNRSGNPKFDEALIISKRDAKNWNILIKNQASSNWAHEDDLELIDNTEMVNFAKRFLNAEGHALLDDGFIEVTIKPSAKMEAEMKRFAVESFLKDYKNNTVTI